MPAKNLRKEKKKIKKIKKKKEKNQKNTKKPIRLKNQDPTRQDTQIHGEVPQPEDSAQSVVTLAQESLYAKRKMLLLSIEEALC